MKRVLKTWQKLFVPKGNQIRYIQLIFHILFIYTFISFPVQTLYGLIWGWFISIFGGILVGHRYVAHSQFEFPNKIIKYFFYFLYNLNTIGSAVNYANIHYLHHKFSDDIEKDPTTYKRTGVLFTYFTFYGFNFSRKINVNQYKLLMKDLSNRFFHNYYYLPHLILSILLLICGIQYFLLFLVVPAVLSFHIAQIQVSLLHLRLPMAFKNYNNSEAYNIPWLKLILFGEELHNNHHANPKNPNRGVRHGISEYDPLYRLIIKPFFRCN